MKIQNDAVKRVKRTEKDGKRTGSERVIMMKTVRTKFVRGAGGDQFLGPVSKLTEG
jgi:hypothetical protein